MKKLLSPNWSHFYGQIKDPSWPMVSYEEEVLDLPKNILQEILFFHDRVGFDSTDSTDRNIIAWRESVEKPVSNELYFLETKTINHDSMFMADNIKVFYHPSLDGGGTTSGQRYRSVLSKLYPGRKFNNCFEWCAGPGFIGFDLLSRNFCDNLYLNDIYPPAIDSIQKTIDHNKEIQNNVFFHHCRSIKDLPVDWKFDLVVSNPPHWNPDLGQFITQINFRDRISADFGWKLHKDFFDNISKHLMPNATILLQECSFASGPAMFEPFMEKNGLYINNCYMEETKPDFFYLEVKSL